MVVKLLFGGSGSRKRRDAATTNAGNKAPAARGGAGGGGGGGTAAAKAGARRGTVTSKSNATLSGQRGPSMHPKKAPAAARLSVVTPSKHPSRTPPTVPSYPYYDDDDNNLSASSSTMLLQLQVQHYSTGTLDDSFEVLTAESQKGVQEKQKQQQKDEQAIRKQLFASPGPEQAGSRRRDEESKDITPSASATSSSRNRPQTSSSAQQHVQFLSFRSAPGPSKASQENKDFSHRQAAASHRISVNEPVSAPSASFLSATLPTTEGSRAATASRCSTEGAPSVGDAIAQKASPPPLETAPPAVGSFSQRQQDKPTAAPGSISLTLPAASTRKPPRPPGGPSLQRAVAEAACAGIAAPSKPFRSHMGSFDTLDTTMSPILKQDLNFSVDTTQTASNVGGQDEPTRAARTDAPASTAQWMEQWQSFKDKLSLAIESCSPGATQLAQQSENLVMDLFYDSSNPLWHCVNQGAFADPRRPVYNEEVTLEFLHLMMTTGITVLLMQPPQTPLNPTMDWKGQSVVVIVEPGGGGGSVIGGGSDSSWVPRLEWTTVAGGRHFEVSTNGLNLLEILSIRSREDEDEEKEGLLDEDDETYPSTDDDRRYGRRRSRRTAVSEHGSMASTTIDDEAPVADFSSFFTITSTSGDVHVFEAASVYDRNRIIQGLRNVIAWLSYATVMGDTTASSILFSEPAHRAAHGDEPGELPMLAKQPQRIAMNRTAHVLLDE